MCARKRARPARCKSSFGKYNMPVTDHNCIHGDVGWGAVEGERPVCRGESPEPIRRAIFGEPAYGWRSPNDKKATLEKRCSRDPVSLPQALAAKLCAKSVKAE